MNKSFGNFVNIKRMDCLFCSIIDNQTEAFKIWEDRNFVLLLDIRPINRGHVLLVTKKHVSYVFSLPKPLYTQLFINANRIAQLLRGITKARRIGLAIEGFGVPHSHVHLVPVNSGNELNPLRAKKVPKEKLRRLQSKFAVYFKKLK